MITPLQDYFIVSIERKIEDTKTKSGIITTNAAWIEESSMESYENKRIYGTVISVPESFSDSPYRAIDDGMPAYHKFVGHDHIVDKINRGYNNHDAKSYYCSTYDEYSVVTNADVAKRVDVRVGDRVYFMPQVTEPENFLEMNGKEFLYKVNVTEIFATARPDTSPDEMLTKWVRTNIIKTQGEWVLITPNKETWDEITTPSGIIMKPNPVNKWLEGIVSFSHYDHLKQGMRIVYLPNADCEVTVEGEKYFVMPVQDVMGEVKSKSA